MARSGIASPLDYLLGRGEIYFSDSLDADGRPKDFRTLGHAEAFTLTLEAETLEHFSKLLGTGNKDREITISQSMDVSFQLSEIDADNLALALAGSNNSVAQAGATVGPSVSGDDNVIVTATTGLGKWYDLFTIQAPTEYPPIGGTRAYRVSSVVVKDTTATTTYVEGTDYDVDYELGRIFVRVGGSISAGDSLCVAFTYATLTISEIRTMESAKIEGVLKFISRNANQSGNGSQAEYQFHQVSLVADGEFALIGDEIATLNMSGSAEPNSTVSANSPVLTVRKLSE